MDCRKTNQEQLYDYNSLLTKNLYEKAKRFLGYFIGIHLKFSGKVDKILLLWGSSRCPNHFGADTVRLRYSVFVKPA